MNLKIRKVIGKTIEIINQKSKVLLLYKRVE